MKSKKYIILNLSLLMLFVCVCFPFILTSCSFAEIDSIEVLQDSIPKSSVEAMTYDIGNIKLQLNRKDNTTQIISCNKLMFSKTDVSKLNVAGTHILHITYQGKETSFTLAVHPYGEPPTYKIRFYIDNGTSASLIEPSVYRTISVPVGGSVDEAEIPIPPAKTYYTTAWNVTDFTNVQNDINVYLVYSPQIYTLLFNYNGGSSVGMPTSKEVAYGSIIGDLPKPVRGGYNFIGWYTNYSYYYQRLVNPTAIATYSSIYPYDPGRVTLYARWEATVASSMKVSPNTPLPAYMILGSSLTLSKYNVIVTMNNGTSVEMPMSDSRITVSYSTSTAGSKSMTIRYSLSSVSITVYHSYTVYRRYSLTITSLQGSAALNNFEGEYYLVSDLTEVPVTEATYTTSGGKQYKQYTINVASIELPYIKLHVYPNSGNTYQLVYGSTVSLRETGTGVGIYDITDLTNASTISIAFSEKDTINANVTVSQSQLNRLNALTVTTENETPIIYYENLGTNIEISCKNESYITLEFTFTANIIIEGDFLFTNTGIEVLDYNISNNRLTVRIYSPKTSFIFNLSNTNIVFME